MKKIIIVVFACLSFCSCLSSYVMYEAWTLKKMPELPSGTEKTDVTFSVDWGYCYELDHVCWGADKKQIFAEIIRNKLIKTGMFRNVKQTTFANKSDYHFDFEVNFIDGATSDIDLGIGVSAGLLGIIPTTLEDVYADFTMRFFAENREMYAIAYPARKDKMFMGLIGIAESPILLPLVCHSNRLSDSCFASDEKVFSKVADNFIADIVINKLYDKQEQIQLARRERDTMESVNKIAQQAAQPASSGGEQESGRKPLAVVFNPIGLAEHDKNVYARKIKKILEKIESHRKDSPNAYSFGDPEVYIPPAGILFKIGSSEILPYYKEMLDSFASLYAETDQKSGVLIVGYSSNAGNETVNNPKLSEQRSDAVREYLTSKISEECGKQNKNCHVTFYIEQHGNSKLSSGMFSNDPGCKGGQCYRRVNVSIISRGDKDAAYNPIGIAELNKEAYLKKSKESAENRGKNSPLAIPPLGVLFKIGSTELMPYYKEMLDSFISLYKKTDGKSSIILHGYSSHSGDETAKKYNISEERALQVQQYLVDHGISKDNISAHNIARRDSVPRGTPHAYEYPKDSGNFWLLINDPEEFKNDPNCKGGQCFRRVNVSIR